ncbi:D-isomer specific 2-hydroxyacid dehydrogenase family protein [Anaerostipes sp.]|uniref:D-isomer specific 2-hydroxyacid dehydrogenase family protein n=1 Tax=Anaerostipes sp. TaxID=1872530 RepID=UPI002ED44662
MKSLKVAVFSCRPDEKEFFNEYARKFHVELSITSEPPTLENLQVVENCQAASVITTPIGKELLDAWKMRGIRTISTRTVGYDHIDLDYARKLGITISNVSYTPHTVAEYTVMTILMTIRKMKTILTRYQVQDYSLLEVRGRELRNMTVGVVGIGKIGEMVIQNLSGFGCKILAYDPYEKESVKHYADYVDLDGIWKSSDIITFHTPALESTYHMVNQESLKKMKKGVMLINMARGSLIDTDALVEALESGKVAAAALDVIENEGKIYYKDYKYTVTANHDMAILSTMPNVLMTPHTAFFTDEAVSDMIEYSLESCKAEIMGANNPRRII